MILQEDRRGTTSIGQLVMGHGLDLYPTDLTARSCPRENSGIIFASDMVTNDENRISRRFVKRYIIILCDI